MNKSKTKKSKTKKSSAKSTKAKTKRVSKSKKSKNSEFEDTGVVVVDDNLTVDKEKELEERRAFLEEARSQDSSD
jgi:choline kinase